MFQTTRRRLAIWYTAVTAILLLLFATGFYLYVRNTLIERIDDTLNHVVEIVERSLVIEPLDTPAAMSPVRLGGQFQVNIEASFPDNNDPVEDDHIDLEWFSPTGVLIWSTFAEPLDIPLHPNRLGETVKIDNNETTSTLPLVLRQVTDRVEKGRQVLGYLRVSHPWFEVSKPIQELILELSFGTILMVISVAAIGWFLSGLAMEPVRQSYQHLKQFTADASHELRSPIASIQTNVQVALAEGNLEPQQSQQLQLIERLTRRLGKLVDDLLFLARQDSGIIQPQQEEVPLDALLMEVIEEQNAIALSQGVTITLEIIDPPTPEENFTLYGDWDQLARLFTNIISNALQYGNEQNQVKILLESITKHKRNSSSLLSILQVQITDTGIGIPADAIDHLFDRFYRVDPARNRSVAGSGLGLAIAKAIVENHQGQIRIDSHLNQGTTAIISLPVNAKIKEER